MRPDNLIYHNKKYEAWVRAKPCLVHGCHEKAQVNHVWNSGGKDVRNSYLSTPKCAEHHLHGFPYSYHTLGKKGFEDKHSVFLEWEIINLLSEYINSIVVNGGKR